MRSKMASASVGSSSQACHAVTGNWLVMSVERVPTRSSSSSSKSFRSCAAIGYRGSPEQFRSAFEAIFTPNREVCALIPRFAKRYKLVLASNTNEIHSQHFRRTYRDVLSHFSALGLSHEAGARKPGRCAGDHLPAIG